MITSLVHRAQHRGEADQVPELRRLLPDFCDARLRALVARLPQWSGVQEAPALPPAISLWSGGQLH